MSASTESSAPVDLSNMVEDVMEKRIENLERLVFGLETPSEQEVTSENTIIERLTQASNMIQSALSGREKINALIERLPEIEKLTEEEVDSSDLRAKQEYILNNESEIKETAQKLKQMNDLLPVLESDRFKNIPEMSEKLNAASLKYIELGEKAENLNAETRDMVSRYNEIITNISKTLIALDQEIMGMEEAAKPKKVLD